MKPLRFTKMQGIGNDFMIVDGLTQDISMSPSQISQLASRTTGVGFDQLLVVETPPSVQTSSIESITPMAQQPGNAAMLLRKVRVR